MSEYGDTVTFHFSFCKQTLSERHYRKLYVVREIRQGFVREIIRKLGVLNFNKMFKWCWQTILTYCIICTNFLLQDVQQKQM